MWEKINKISRSKKHPASLLSHCKWSGPYKVLREIGKNSYLLELPNTMKIHPVVSWSYLEKYHSSNKFSSRVIDPPPPVEIDSHLEYVVESIVNHRKRYNKNEYLVHWKGYGEQDCTWEPELALKNSDSILKDYKKRHKIK